MESVNKMDDNISRLKFIARLKKGEKINTKDMTVQQNNLLTKINRSFLSIDNRTNTLNFLVETVKKGFEELQTHIDNMEINIFDKTMGSNILLDLENCKNGFSNLKDTYVDDIMFCCKIDTIDQEIDARLKSIKTKYFSTSIEHNSVPISISHKKFGAGIYSDSSVDSVSIKENCVNVKNVIGSVPSSFGSIE